MRLVSLLADRIRIKLSPLGNRVKKRLKSIGIRPRNQKDYYALGRWMVSKRLASAWMIAAGVFSLVYVIAMMPKDLLGSQQYRTYRYDAVPLKFYNGTVRILGKSGYTAYIGTVKKGAAQGEGTLYQPDGSVVYEGAFSKSMFHGKGRLFYPEGALQYEGTFRWNLFSGEGKKYKKSGILEYAGEFSEGAQQGEGELYNEAGQKIYKGAFLGGSISYETFLGKTTAEVSERYMGKKIIYSFEHMIGMRMEEIEAMYVGRQEEGSLEEGWQVTGIYILKDVFRDGKHELRTAKELKAELGLPVYQGYTAVTWADAAALHQLPDVKEIFGQPPAMETEAEFEDVINVEGFDSSYEVYLTAYVRDGYRYLFFSPEKSDTFSFYLIEPAEEGTG